MRIPRATWLSAAAIAAVAGLLSSSADLLVLSAAVVSAGVVGEAASALGNRRRLAAPSPDFLPGEAEERLLLTEAALAAANEEIATLKRQRASDASEEA